MDQLNVEVASLQTTRDKTARQAEQAKDDRRRIDGLTGWSRGLRAALRR